MSDIGEQLDEEQRNAVRAPEFAIAVLAGPGSGKTARSHAALATC
jgi:superfamily I DNA/RNA helicase